MNSWTKKLLLYRKSASFLSKDQHKFFLAWGFSIHFFFGIYIFLVHSPHYCIISTAGNESGRKREMFCGAPYLRPSSSPTKRALWTLLHFWDSWPLRAKVFTPCVLLPSTTHIGRTPCPILYYTTDAQKGSYSRLQSKGIFKKRRLFYNPIFCANQNRRYVLLDHLQMLYSDVLINILCDWLRTSFSQSEASVVWFKLKEPSLIFMFKQGFLSLYCALWLVHC